MICVSVLDCRAFLGSSGLEEWSKVWFVMWGIVPISPWAQCSHPIAQPGLSMCMWSEARYMHFGH